MIRPNGPHMVLHELAGVSCTVMSLENTNLVPLLATMIGARTARRALIKDGQRLDVELMLDDRPAETRPLTLEEAVRDWVEGPMPAIGYEEKKRLPGFEDDAALAFFWGFLVLRIKERLLWGSQAVLATVATLGTLATALVGTMAGTTPPGLGAPAWFGIFALVEAIHLADLPAAFKARRNEASRKGLTGPRGAAAAL